MRTVRSCGRLRKIWGGGKAQAAGASGLLAAHANAPWNAPCPLSGTCAPAGLPSLTGRLAQLGLRL